MKAWREGLHFSTMVAIEGEFNIEHLMIQVTTANPQPGVILVNGWHGIVLIYGMGWLL